LGEFNGILETGDVLITNTVGRPIKTRVPELWDKSVRIKFVLLILAKIAWIDPKVWTTASFNTSELNAITRSITGKGFIILQDGINIATCQL
jgi:hypothetical protein